MKEIIRTHILIVLMSCFTLILSACDESMSAKNDETDLTSSSPGQLSSSALPYSSSSIAISSSALLSSSSVASNSSSFVSSSSSATSSSSIFISSSSSVIPYSSSEWDSSCSNATALSSSSYEESSSDSESSSSEVVLTCVDSLTYGTLIDLRDNQIYKTVKICTQTWMAQNLNYDYNKSSAKSYCYNDSAAQCEKFGRLYLWSAAMDSAAVFSNTGKDCGFGTTCQIDKSTFVRGVCPEGWHLPDSTEWAVLLDAAGGSANAGKVLKAVNGWKYSFQTDSKEEINEDSYGFSAMPAGLRSKTGSFSAESVNGLFWTSSQHDETFAYDVAMVSFYHWAHIEDSFGKSYAYSVRCLMD